MYYRSVGIMKMSARKFDCMNTYSYDSLPNLKGLFGIHILSARCPKQKQNSPISHLIQLLPTRQPSQEVRLTRRQNHRAARIPQIPENISTSA